MSGAVPWCSAERPFPGLRPFQKQDADWFFGRDAQSTALYRLVRESRFVAVVGASGSGKSSLVKAGLLPRLEHVSSLLGPPWHLFETRPGNAPIRRLSEVLAGLDPETRGTPPGPAGEADDRRIARFSDRQERLGLARWGIAPLLNGRSDGLARALDLAPDASAAGRVLLVVDQFEELFRFGEEAGGEERAARREEARAFVELLLRGAGDPDGRLTVLVTMRSDFFGDCGRFQGLAEAVSASQYLVPQLDRESLVPIIRRPVERAGAGIDPRLVQTLLLDREENDRLPVLQHALMRLWSIAGERPGVRHLALEDYRRIGGLEEALSRHAEEVRKEIEGWTADGPTGAPAAILVERLFKELTDTDRQNRAIRRRRTVAELEAVAAAGPDGGIDPARAAALRRVIDRFRDPDCSFLVPSPAEVPELTGEHQIDIGHEALIRRWRAIAGEAPNANDGEAEQWRRLGWLEQERRDGDSWRLLLSAAQEWDRTPSAGKPGKLLPETAERKRWRARVNATAAWADRHGGGLALVDAFLAACEKARLRRRTWARLMAGALVATVCAIVAAGFMAFERVSEERNHAMELALRYSDRLADDALRELGTGETRAAANLIAEAFPDWVDDPLPWRDTLPHRALEQILASRPAARGDWLLEKNGNAVFALSPDGRHVAAGSLDRQSVSLWDAASRSLVWETPEPPEETFRFHAFPSLAFSPDGNRLTTPWAEGKVRVFETATGEVVAEFEGHGGDVNAVAMNPAGDRVASAGDDRTLRLWRIGAAGAEAVVRHNAGVTAVAWSPDGRRVATATEYGLVTVLDVAGPEPRVLGKTAPRSAFITALRFSPDGGTLAVGDARGQVFLGPVRPDGLMAEPVVIEAHTSAIQDLLFTDGGKLLLTGGWTDGAAAWNAVTGQALGVFEDFHGVDVMAQPAGTADLVLVMNHGVVAVRELDALTPPKNRLRIPESRAFVIAAGKSGPVSIRWDSRSGLEYRAGSASGTTQAILPSGGRNPARMALSASGGFTALQFAETVEIAPPGGEPWVIDAADWAPDGTLVSDDGRRVVGWNADRIRVWDAGSEQPSDVALPEAGISAIAMDASGKSLAFGTESGRAGLVDLDERRELWSFGVFEARIAAIALSPEDGIVAVSAFGETPERNATAILDPRPGRPAVTTVGGFGGMTTLAFMDGGETLVGSDGNNVAAARTWDGVRVASGGGYDVPDIFKLVNAGGEGPIPALGSNGEILSLDRKTLGISVSVAAEESDIRDAWITGAGGTASAITLEGRAHHWKGGSPWPAVSRTFEPGSTLIPLPSGSLLVGVAQGVAIWDPDRDSVEPVPRTGPAMPRAVALAPDAGSIVVVRSDGAVDHLSLPDGRLLRSLGHADEEPAMVLTDGTTAVLHQPDRMRGWRLSDGAEIAFVRPEQGLARTGLSVRFGRPRPVMGGYGNGRVLVAGRTGAVEVWVPGPDAGWRSEWWRAARAENVVPLQSGGAPDTVVSSSATRIRSRFGGSTSDNSVNLLRLWSPGLDRVLAHAAVLGQPVSLRIEDGRWHVLVQRAGALHVETVTPHDSDLKTLLGELRALRAEGLAEFTPEERARYRVDPLTSQAQPDRQDPSAPSLPGNRGGSLPGAAPANRDGTPIDR